MNKYIVGLFIISIFLHIIDDYGLQGILASMKQKKYWEENAPDNLYKYDYIWALIMHSFSWSFMIMLPLFFISNFIFNFPLIVIFVWNIICHAIIDNAKANEHLINLWEDQILHICQLLITYWWFFMYVY